jgi:hypothetical protein
MLRRTGILQEQLWLSGPFTESWFILGRVGRCNALRMYHVKDTAIFLRERLQRPDTSFQVRFGANRIFRSLSRLQYVSITTAALTIRLQWYLRWGCSFALFRARSLWGHASLQGAVGYFEAGPWGSSVHRAAFLPYFTVAGFNYCGVRARRWDGR